MSPRSRAGSQDGAQTAGGIHHLALVATHLSSTAKSASSTSQRKFPALAPVPLDPTRSVNSLSLRELLDFRTGLKEDCNRMESDMSRMERLLSRGHDHLKLLEERIQIVEAKSTAPVVWEINSAKSASGASNGEGSGSEKASAETSVMEKDLIEFWGGQKTAEAIKLSARPMVAQKAVASVAGAKGDVVEAASSA